ncbi:MAG: linear amide C-N hydrolase [Ruminococcus sp.]|nr:linear amide C-N hydrolase [Ruminococcus sp.]
MKYKGAAVVCMFAVIIFLLIGCGNNTETSAERSANFNEKSGSLPDDADSEADMRIISLSSEVVELESGLSAVKFEGDYGFEEYLAGGGASSDADVAAFLLGYLVGDAGDFSFGGDPFGCSTISVKNTDGGQLFGRNFDWNRCNAMIVQSVPESGYASISTVNTDFIQGVGFSHLPDEMKALIALYAPLDGMNEKGLVVSVNMIQDNATIAQDTERPDITTTTAVRLLLDQAADTAEAVALLEKYDLHASMNYMVHFAIADADGKSVVVEYVDNEMVVVQTPVVTNFYMAEGDKKGIGTAQSHTRYEMLTERLKESGIMSAEDVRDALRSVSKGNFGEFESTEWSVVFNQSSGEAWYYHRENYEYGYIFRIGQDS